MVDFLLSDSAGFISGVALPVDGAYRYGEAASQSIGGALSLTSESSPPKLDGWLGDEGDWAWCGGQQKGNSSSRDGGPLGAAALAAPAIRSASAQTKTLVIGGSVPLTGAAAETGLNVNNGYITAVSYINDVVGGVEIAGEKYKLELKLFDDASDPARATTLIQRQIDEGTNFRSWARSAPTSCCRPRPSLSVPRSRWCRPAVVPTRSSPSGFKYVFGMYPRDAAVRRRRRRCSRR